MAYRQPAVHRTIVLVDVEGFGNPRRTNHDQVVVRDGLYRALRQAFDNAGIMWANCDREDRGDGVFILAPAEISKAPFVEVLPHTLVATLRAHNTAHSAEQQIRLRMALHAGEVAYDEHGVTAASVNLAFRLLAAEPLKTALAQSPGVLALVTSAWFFDEVVRHSLGLDPTRFRPIRVTVKETSTLGWISLPDHPYPSDATQLEAASLGEPTRPVPHQLPAAPGSFTGRADELAVLTAALDTAPGSGGTVVISAIAGVGGMGKTWLALQWAHQHIGRFPDGQLFVDLRGFSPDSQPMAPAMAVRGFLDALGIDTAHLPVDLHAQTALFRSLVADKRMLMVLDNAVDAAQVTPLLPGSPTVTVLVTSRNHLPGLIATQGAHHLLVDVLTEAESRALLAARLGTPRVAAEPAAVNELIACCGELPLALSIVAGRAHTHPHTPLAALAAELRDAGLDALDDDDPTASLPTVLSWSYRALTGEQATAFGSLGIAPGPDISLSAAASLTGLSMTRTRAVLRGLEQASLLGQDTSGRYRMHDLIRRYAADRAHDDHTQVDRDAAVRRVIDFYLHTADAGERLLDPIRPGFLLDPPARGCRPHPLPDYAAAMAWFEAEHPSVLAAQQVAAARGWHRAVWKLAWTLYTFHSRRGRLRDGIAVWQAGLAAAHDLNDSGLLAHAHHQLGRAYAMAGHHADALDHLRQALVLAENTHRPGLLVHIHRVLAVAAEQQGDDRKALEHATHALNLDQTSLSPVREAEAHNAVGWYSARLGQHDTARAHCQTALTVHRRHHHRDGEAASLKILGYIAHHTGQHTRAIDYYQQALTLRRDQGNTYQEANILEGIGHPHLALGHREQANAAWQQALQLYQAQYRPADADRIQQQLNQLEAPQTSQNCCRW